MKVNANVLVLSGVAVFIAILSFIGVLVWHGTDPSAVGTMITSVGGSLATLVITIATLVKSQHAADTATAIKADTDAILNGTMQAKIVDGVKTALSDTGVATPTQGTPAWTPPSDGVA